MARMPSTRGTPNTMNAAPQGLYAGTLRRIIRLMVPGEDHRTFRRACNRPGIARIGSDETGLL